MNVAVVGAGALGSLFAARFALADLDVLLVARDERRAARIRENGLTLEEGGEERTARIACVAGTAGERARDLVLMCVKAYDTKEAIAAHGSLAGPDSTVLTLQNGLGNLETIAGAVGADRALAGITTEAALLLEPGRVRHTGARRDQDTGARGRARTI
ncbi:MAG: 2-dehydropantoate 2-reductase [Deltaproteobacteria bacterium]|nr:2-dehydropantoate 2-reductase [Deltaproteobacteria bacterium]